MSAGLVISEGSKGESVPCLSPSFRWFAVNVGCSLASATSPQPLPLSLLGLFSLCLSVSVSKFPPLMRITVLLD